MSLSDKIKKIINVIEDTAIEEIEISSFWGAQKIKLSKKSSSNSPAVYIKPDKVSDDKTVDIIKDDSTSNKEQQSEKVNDKIEQSLDEKKPSDDSASVIINEEELEYQKAPLVGTFYASSKPGEPPFVNVGEKVSKGQTICIIEAMKIFNEIEAEMSGRVIEILVEDGTPVEYDQPLVIIAPI